MRKREEKSLLGFWTFSLAPLFILASAFARQVEEVQQAVKQKRAKRAAGENSMTRLSPADRLKRLGHIPTAQTAQEPAQTFASSALELPAIKGFTGPICGRSFTATWTVGFFVMASLGSDAENAVMNIFWPLC